MQFPKTIPYKSTPNSPTSKKVPRPEIKVTKTDNILTIRKKKLDALKEKVTKKWYFWIYSQSSLSFQRISFVVLADPKTLFDFLLLLILLILVIACMFACKVKVFAPETLLLKLFGLFLSSFSPFLASFTLHISLFFNCEIFVILLNINIFLILFNKLSFRFWYLPFNFFLTGILK